MLTIGMLNRRPPNQASDLFEQDAFLGDTVIACSRGALLQCKPEKMSSIKPMHSGPAVEPFAYIGGNAFLTGQIDEERNETVIALAMHGGSEPNYRHAHAAFQQRGSRRRSPRISLGVGRRRVSSSVAVRP
jgi:hypothetical protein